MAGDQKRRAFKILKRDRLGSSINGLSTGKREGSQEALSESSTIPIPPLHQSALILGEVSEPQHHFRVVHYHRNV